MTRRGNLGLLAAIVMLAAMTGCSDKSVGTPDEPDVCYEWLIFDENSGTSRELMDIVFVDDTTGWSVGRGGVVAHTTNGGSSWTLQTSNTTADLWGVSFADVDRGFAVGANGVFIATVDGGAHWDATSITSSDLTDVFAWGDLQVWAVGSRVILKSQDGGGHWEPLQTPENIWYCVTFASSKLGWAVGLDDDGGVSPSRGSLWYTDDGDEWIPQGGTFSHPLLGVDFGTTTAGWMVGVGGDVHHSSDGGYNWIEQYPPTALVLHGVDFLDDSLGIAVGDSAVIEITENGGEDWDELQGQGTYTLRGVAVVDGYTAFACGSDGYLIKIVKSEVNCP